MPRSKKETEHRINGGMIDAEDEEIVKLFTDDDYDWIGQSIINQNNIWNTFNEDFTEFLHEAIFQKRKEIRGEAS